MSSGRVSIGDFAQATVEKNSYGRVNSRRESPKNRSVGGEARKEAQRADPSRVDRGDDGNRNHDQTGGRGLLELFDNEPVEKGLCSQSQGANLIRGSVEVVDPTVCLSDK